MTGTGHKWHASSQQPGWKNCFPHSEILTWDSLWGVLCGWVSSTDSPIGYESMRSVLFSRSNLEWHVTQQLIPLHCLWIWLSGRLVYMFLLGFWIMIIIFLNSSRSSLNWPPVNWSARLTNSPFTLWNILTIMDWVFVFPQNLYVEILTPSVLGSSRQWALTKTWLWHWSQIFSFQNWEISVADKPPSLWHAFIAAWARILMPTVHWGMVARVTGGYYLVGPQCVVSFLTVHFIGLYSSNFTIWPNSIKTSDTRVHKERGMC